jgi:prepilin-type N-terminal cleavage/methylation domain-containing protein
VRRPRRHGGYSLVELAVVAAILGLLALGMTSAFEGMGQAREQNGAQAHAEAARLALRHFMLRNKRLPCPDDSAYGARGRQSGTPGNCPGGLSVGWLPYESLGLSIPVRAQRLRYGVRRGSGTDLVAPVAGAIDGPDLEGSAGLAKALKEAARTAPSSTFPYYAASTAVATSTTCAGTDLVNPAFAVVAPATDRDGRGTHPGFDAPNLGFADGTDTCMTAPARPGSATYDDVVVAESASALLGWLTASTR